MVNEISFGGLLHDLFQFLSMALQSWNFQYKILTGSLILNCFVVTVSQTIFNEFIILLKNEYSLVIEFVLLL